MGQLTNRDKRLEILFNESHTWLLKVSYNITKSYEESEDLVGDLYVYLHRKGSPKIHWKESYNLIYCMRFLQTRWINKVKKLNRYVYTDTFNKNQPDEEYDIQRDIDVMQAYEDVKTELQKLKKTPLFPQAIIYDLYWMSDDNLNEVAGKIGISTSTTFKAIKRIRNHMKTIINNPFTNE